MNKKTKFLSLGESQIPGGYQHFLAKDFPPEKVNRTLDFFNIYWFNKHGDISYGQNLERRIGLFDFELREHRLKLECVGGQSSGRTSSYRKALLQSHRRHSLHT